MVSSRPETLKEALFFLRERPSATIFSGGTDLMVTKKITDSVLFTDRITEMKALSVRTDETGASFLSVGAALPYCDLIASDLIPPVMKEVFLNVASPAIRSRGTMGGNICNASPAGDTLPMLYALGAVLELARPEEGPLGPDIVRRSLPVQDFIKGVKKVNLLPGELLTGICLPLKNLSDGTRFYYKKVGARRAEAISKLSVFGFCRTEDHQIAELQVAFGAVASRVVCPAMPEGLSGTRLSDLTAKADDLTAYYLQEVRPIDDQRSTASYRRRVAENLFRDLLNTFAENDK